MWKLLFNKKKIDSNNIIEIIIIKWTDSLVRFWIFSFLQHPINETILNGMKILPSSFFIFGIYFCLVKRTKKKKIKLNRNELWKISEAIIIKTFILALSVHTSRIADTGSVLSDIFHHNKIFPFNDIIQFQFVVQWSHN